MPEVVFLWLGTCAPPGAAWVCRLSDGFLKLKGFFALAAEVWEQGAKHLIRQRFFVILFRNGLVATRLRQPTACSVLGVQRAM